MPLFRVTIARITREYATQDVVAATLEAARVAVQRELPVEASEHLLVEWLVDDIEERVALVEEIGPDDAAFGGFPATEG